MWLESLFFCKDIGVCFHDLEDRYFEPLLNPAAVSMPFWHGPQTKNNLNQASEFHVAKYVRLSVQQQLASLKGAVRFRPIKHKPFWRNCNDYHLCAINSTNSKIRLSVTMHSRDIRKFIIKSLLVKQENIALCINIFTEDRSPL